MRCAVIADDLTGACDAAVHFAERGASTSVLLDWDQSSEAEVVALSTGSRDLDEAEIHRRIERAAAVLRNRVPFILFKKIDSTLRGNVGAEIRAAADVFDCDLVVIAPAFPALGRTVHRGLLHVDGWPEPLDIAARLRSQGLDECRHVAPEALTATIATGTRFVSVDAVCREDLQAIVKQAIGAERRILWAGSGGLAAALAGALCGGSTRITEPPSLNRSPVLFAIGSTHSVTVDQQQELIRSRPVYELDAATASSEELRAALAEEGRHTILRITQSVTRTRLSGVLRGNGDRIGALLLSGGDTAALVCQAIGATAIHLRHEITPGTPWGTLAGGGLDGVPVATKSGGFGHPTTLVRVADFFNSASCGSGSAAPPSRSPRSS